MNLELEDSAAAQDTLLVRIRPSQVGPLTVSDASNGATVHTGSACHCAVTITSSSLLQLVQVQPSTTGT